MTASPFTHDAKAGCVTWKVAGRRFRLQEREVEMILDIFQREEAAELFNQTYDAHLAAGGVPLVSSMIRKAA